MAKKYMMKFILNYLSETLDRQTVYLTGLPLLANFSLDRIIKQRRKIDCPQLFRQILRKARPQYWHWPDSISLGARAKNGTDVNVRVAHSARTSLR